VSQFREDGRALRSEPLVAGVLGQVDAVVIVTDHSTIDYQFIVDNASLIIDTRNATRACHAGRARIVSLSGADVASPVAYDVDSVKVLA
jgi:UDP-N-acetyl-D-glucosamine dehydrogenase